MAKVHRLGFSRLSPSTQSDEDIVFIHGLLGHPQGTWEMAAGASHGSSDETKKPKGLRSFFKSRKDRSSTTDTGKAAGPASSVGLSRPLPTVFWPKEYLAVDIPEARVWTYGYNADVIGDLFQANNKNSISQHGRDLSVHLEREIDNGKPLVFIAYSLGGIVLKDAIRRSELARNQTKLIVFLGTPHRGSAYAGWGEVIFNLSSLALQDSNKKIIKRLEHNDEVLDNIHEEFKTIVFGGTMKIHSFQEAQGITGMKGASAKVVDDFSSKLDLPLALEIVESIDANHIQMVRYSSRDDLGYRAIFGVLK
ncbi:hypothetical protein BU24DRAFT_377777, partial [Aaosphaeria arxii CBS 175.79]